MDNLVITLSARRKDVEVSADVAVSPLLLNAATYGVKDHILHDAIERLEKEVLGAVKDRGLDK